MFLLNIKMLYLGNLKQARSTIPTYLFNLKLEEFCMMIEKQH